MLTVLRNVFIKFQLRRGEKYGNQHYERQFLKTKYKKLLSNNLELFLEILHPNKYLQIITVAPRNSGFVRQ